MTWYCDTIVSSLYILVTITMHIWHIQVLGGNYKVVLGLYNFNISIAEMCNLYNMLSDPLVVICEQVLCYCLARNRGVSFQDSVTQLGLSSDMPCST